MKLLSELKPVQTQPSYQDSEPGLIHLKYLSSLSESKSNEQSNLLSSTRVVICSDCQSKQLKESDSSYLRVSQLT